MSARQQAGLAISGVEIALWDLAGKRSGMPLHQLLGGASRSEVVAYASLVAYGLPHVVAEKSGEAVDQGFRHVKLHEVGVPEVEAARAAVGPEVGLMLDTNCGWSFEQALGMADRLAPYELRWVED